jgi:acyl dehydratase
MTKLYFEELEIGTRSAAGPYPVFKEEIIQFANQYDPVPRHKNEEAAAGSVFLGADCVQRPYLCHRARARASHALGPSREPLALLAASIARP